MFIIINILFINIIFIKYKLYLTSDIKKIILYLVKY